MRRSASQIIRNLEHRIARLERQASKKIRLSRADEFKLLEEVSGDSLESAELLRSGVNPFYQTSFELVKFSYTIFMGGGREYIAYAIFEIEDGKRELLRVSRGAREERAALNSFNRYIEEE